MTQHLLLITIGPVQDFIAQARRTRDLWYGSHLLSELSRVAAMAVVANGGRLIFPALDKNIEDELDELAVCPSPLRDNGKPPLNIANKVFAELPPGVIPETLAKEARRSVSEFWVATAGRVRAECSGLLVSSIEIDKAWAEQIDSLIEFAAAWAPVDDKDGGYREARLEVEKAIAARKNLRDFEPWTNQRGGVPKSSLDGARETVLRDPKKEPRDKTLAHTYRIADAEQLDAVGLIKRAGGRPDQFVPIVNVALASWIAFADKHCSARLEKLRRDCATLDLARVKRDKLPGVRPFMFDASIFLPSRWRSTFEEQGLGTPAKADAWGKCHLRTLLGELSEPFPYVACLVADGDRMGGAIDIFKDAQDHRTFSRNLALFAADARRIVEQDHLGSLVYSGGDDVLAFVPLPEVLKCAEALRQSFSNTMRVACASIANEADFKLPTLSVGVGIGHVMDGMGDLLALGRQAEKLAKGSDLPNERDRRDALAILVDKRSGGMRQWRVQWKHDPVVRLRDDAKLFAKGAQDRSEEQGLSRRKVYEIARTLARLPQAKEIAATEGQQWARLLELEVLRSLGRMEGGGMTIDSKSLRPKAVAQRLGMRLTIEDYAVLRGEVSSWVDRVLIAAALAEAEPALRGAREVAV